MTANNSVQPTNTHSVTARWWALVVAAVLVLAGILAALLLPAPQEIAAKSVDGLSVFAGFYIVAQTIERLLEPFTRWSDQDKQKQEQEKKNAETKMAAADNPNAKAQCDEAISEAEARLKQIKANLAVVLWGVSSFIAMVICGLLGLSFLGATGMQVPTKLRFLDTIVSGMAVGGGTKGLHDLISLITKQKEQA